MHERDRTHSERGQGPRNRNFMQRTVKNLFVRDAQVGTRGLPDA